MQYQLLPKNHYLFKQGDLQKRFFGIISGKLSIRTIIKKEPEEKKEINTIDRSSSTNMAGYLQHMSSNTISNFLHDKMRKKINYESPDLVKEEVLAIVSTGYCIGHYAVAYDIPRTASAYSLEDTHLFYLDKSYFEISIQKDIVKADQDRRIFLLERLPIIECITKMEDYVTRIVPIVYIT
jgi:CRP-like cAMP-binding protein